MLTYRSRLNEIIELLLEGHDRLVELHPHTRVYYQDYHEKRWLWYTADEHVPDERGRLWLADYDTWCHFFCSSDFWVPQPIPELLASGMIIGRDWNRFPMERFAACPHHLDQQARQRLHTTTDWRTPPPAATCPGGHESTRPQPRWQVDQAYAVAATPNAEDYFELVDSLPPLSVFVSSVSPAAREIVSQGMQVVTKSFLVRYCFCEIRSPVHEFLIWLEPSEQSRPMSISEWRDLFDAYELIYRWINDTPCLMDLASYHQAELAGPSVFADFVVQQLRLLQSNSNQPVEGDLSELFPVRFTCQDTISPPRPAPSGDNILRTENETRQDIQTAHQSSGPDIARSARQYSVGAGSEDNQSESEDSDEYPLRIDGIAIERPDPDYVFRDRGPNRHQNGPNNRHSNNVARAGPRQQHSAVAGRHRRPRNTPTRYHTQPR